MDAQSGAKEAQTADVFIVEPRLWTAKGHQMDHVVEFARAAKAAAPQRRIVLLSAPQDDELAARLRQCGEIDEALSCFRHRRFVEDDGGPFDILKKSVEDAVPLRAAIRRRKSGGRVALFFPTLGLHGLLMLAMLRLTMPGLRVKAAGIFRREVVDATGRFSRKYKLFSQSLLTRPFWKLATGQTMGYSDSVILQEVYRERLGLELGLLPVLAPGVWGLPPDAGDAVARTGAPQVVGFIGEPGAGRCFDLFVLTAMAMEQERRSGQVEFLAVMSPSYHVTPEAAPCLDVFRQGLPGMRLEQRWMPAPSDFVSQMRRADILWNVYDPAVFLGGTSGRLVHGMCLGQRMVCSRWKWSEAAVRPCSMVRLVEPKLEQTVAAVRSLMAAELDEASRDEVRRWRRDHSQQAWNEFVTGALRRCDE